MAARARQLARAVVLAAARVGGGRRDGPGLRLRPARAKPSTRRGSRSGFGWLGDLLAAPAARWDRAWYLVIAHYGYRPDLGLTARAPRSSRCIPLALRAVSWLGPPPILAGVLLSLVAFALALYGIHRLATLELARYARRTLAATGSRAPRAGGDADGVRADGLLLLGRLLGVALPGALGRPLLERAPRALGVGGDARRARRRHAQRRPRAAAAGVHALPVRARARTGRRITRGAAAAASARLRRAIGCDATLLWLGLLPGGVVAVLAYLALAGGDPLAPLHAQDVWEQALRRPISSASGMDRARHSRAPASCFPFSATTSTSRPAEAARSWRAGHNLMLFAFLAAAIPALVGVVAAAAARLWRLCARGARAAAVLPGRPRSR